MDHLRLRGMRFFCRVGHTEAERDTGHHLEVDVDLALDLSEAGRHDDMDASVNYTRVHAAVAEVLEDARFTILEGAAEAAATAVRDVVGTRADEVVVRVRKLHPPVPDGLMDHAEVEVRR